MKVISTIPYALLLIICFSYFEKENRDTTDFMALSSRKVTL